MIRQVTLVKMVNHATAHLLNWGSWDDIQATLLFRVRIPRGKTSVASFNFERNDQLYHFHWFYLKWQGLDSIYTIHKKMHRHECKWDNEFACSLIFFILSVIEKMPTVFLDIEARPLFTSIRTRATSILLTRLIQYYAVTYRTIFITSTVSLGQEFRLNFLVK